MKKYVRMLHNQEMALELRKTYLHYILLPLSSCFLIAYIYLAVVELN